MKFKLFGDGSAHFIDFNESNSFFLVFFFFFFCLFFLFHDCPVVEIFVDVERVNERGVGQVLGVVDLVVIAASNDKRHSEKSSKDGKG